MIFLLFFLEIWRIVRLKRVPVRQLRAHPNEKRARYREKSMKKSLIAAAFFAASSLGAGAAEKVQVMETVKLDAAPAKVWARIGHFSDMSWHPAVKSTKATDGDKTGSQRSLDLGGPIIVESLEKSEAGKSYTYKILDNGENQKVLPVSHYTSTIMVKPDGQGSEVVWNSEFEPVAGTAPDAAKKAITGVYRGGLDNIAKALAAN
jgi:hypothetical protein